MEVPAVEKRTVVITGGNAGIGKAMAADLVGMGHHVVIVSRNKEKGEAALAEIRQQRSTAEVDLLVGSLDTIASTKQLAQAIIDNYPQISVLINNAGVWMHQRIINDDGLEYSFMVNHMAPFILSSMLFPVLQANAPARIVNVNAGLYIKGKLDLSKTPYGKDFGRMASYINTKLCNAIFTREFARATAGSGVTINAVHPGVIRTGLGDTTGLMGALLRLVKRSWDTPEAGAEAPVWLATAPELDSITGRYFLLKEETDYATNATDDALNKQLCDLSAELSGIKMPTIS